MPKSREDLPDPLKRSSDKAQRTFIKAHDSAEETYDGDEEIAHRTAYSALKHSFERKGDRWVGKGEKGPSDPHAKMPAPRKRAGEGETYAGVDAEGNSKEALYERARKLGIEGRSKMSKDELAKAISRRQ
ncbi:MAG: ChaB family protein [Actinomycetota bacterium]|nr:ChaB family protein [Actinomycetota bacterium]